jgi:hypothetical protein
MDEEQRQVRGSVERIGDVGLLRDGSWPVNRRSDQRLEVDSAGGSGGVA